MIIKKISAYAVLMTLIFSPLSAEEIKPHTPSSFSQSFNLFKDICVKPLPFSEDFFEAIEATNINWRKLRKERDNKLGLGDSWSANEGRIDYQFLPSSEFSVTDPACDFIFNVGESFDHDLARQEISTYLILDSKNTSNKDALEACWQGEMDDGRNIRFRLTSGFESDGHKKAKLSIGYIKKFPLNLENQLRRTGQLECR